MRPPGFLSRAVCAALLLMPGGLALGADRLDPVGEWEVESGEARYRINYCGEKQICAILTWLREDARTAENLAMLNSRVGRGENSEGGRSWDGEVRFNGQTYSASMTLLSNDVMRVNGCTGVLCRSYELRRR